MNISNDLAKLLAGPAIDELQIFHLAGREIATDRIARSHEGGDAFTADEAAFLALVLEGVMSATRDVPRIDHLAPEAIVHNGMRAKFANIDEGFWT